MYSDPTGRDGETYVVQTLFMCVFYAGAMIEFWGEEEALVKTKEFANTGADIYGAFIDITDKLTSEMNRNAAELAFLAMELSAEYAISVFYDNVKTGGDWDFKNDPSWNLKNYYVYWFDGVPLRNDDIGNIHYGFVGRVLFSEEALLLAAGIVQIISGTSSFKYFRSHFDEPRDQWAISLGYHIWD